MTSSCAPGDSAQRIAETQPQLKHAQDAARDAHERMAKLAKAADDYGKTWTGDLEIYITEAKTEIAIGNFSAAKQKLAGASKRLAKGQRYPELDDAYGQLYFKMAQAATDADEKRKLFQQAQASYQRVARGGGGTLAQRANEHLGEIADELKAP